MDGDAKNWNMWKDQIFVFSDNQSSVDTLGDV